MDKGLAELNSAIQGIALAPEDEGYEKARKVWNAMIDKKPALIVRCQSSADVVAAVNYARQAKLPISIRAGGHNVAGHAVCDDGVMIDLSLMRNVEVDVDRKIAFVDGGAIWRDVDQATQKHSLATPGGLISDTGVAGLTLSGGIGWLRSRYGLCIDNILSAEVVTANGEILTVSESENTDLFWALRGGGGNFGIVTRFDFKLHKLGPKVMFCAPIYPIEAGAGPIRAWRDFMAKHSDVVGSLVEFATVAEGPDFPEDSWDKKVYTLLAVYAGDADEGEKLLQPLRELGDMVTDFSGQMDYCELQTLFDPLVPAGDYRSYWKSHYLSGLSDDVIDQILEGFTSAASPNTLSSIWSFGGATAEVSADATAFGDRSMPYMFSIDSVWPDKSADDKNITWTRDFWNRMKPHSDKGRMYLNFPGQGEEGEKLLQDTFGDNYGKLQSIKKIYDPDNLFRFNQNITPA
ncbi:MAG: FAD/FMN-containing dehydrogenase [Planctomycetota bacterium]|jgi:FAD/FMN-containing dehydrogenase